MPIPLKEILERTIFIKENGSSNDPSQQMVSQMVIATGFQHSW